MTTPLASSPHATQYLIAHLTAAYRLLEPFNEAKLEVDLNDQMDINNWLSGIEAMLEGISMSLLAIPGYIVRDAQDDSDENAEDFIPF